MKEKERKEVLGKRGTLTHKQVHVTKTLVDCRILEVSHLECSINTMLTYKFRKVLLTLQQVMEHNTKYRHYVDKPNKFDPTRY